MTDAFRARSQWLASAVMPHEPALRAWLRGRRLSGIDLDDVIQETYSILAGLDTVDHIRQPRTYMFQVARSLIADQVRRAKIVSISSVADVDVFDRMDEHPSPETQASDRQELNLLARSIAALSERRRQVFILRKIEGLSQREVAQRLGISEGAVENRVARSVEALGKLLGRGEKPRSRASSVERRLDPPEVKPVDGRARDKRRDL